MLKPARRTEKLSEHLVFSDTRETDRGDYFLYYLFQSSSTEFSDELILI